MTMEISVVEFAPITWETCKEIVYQRQRGVCICGKPIQDFHHGLTRKKPKGWKALSEPLKSAWPHVPMHIIGLCNGGHWWAAQALKHSEPLILAWIYLFYGDEEWEGKTYREWLEGPPFRAFLFGEEKK